MNLIRAGGRYADLHQPQRKISQTGKQVAEHHITFFLLTLAARPTFSDGLIRQEISMAAFNTQKVLSVHHWTDAYFTFTCTRDESLRFENGQFVMVGLMVDGKPLMRAYSVASANWEEHLEFFSIKVQDGPLTSRLQHLKVGDDVLISKKPTGTLVAGDLIPANTLPVEHGIRYRPFLEHYQRS